MIFNEFMIEIQGSTFLGLRASLSSLQVYRPLLFPLNQVFLQLKSNKYI